MKLLKDFFSYIKNMIKKNKNKTEENNLEQLSNHTQKVEDYEDLSNQEQIIEDYEYFYNQIEVGDIIWAKRYQNEIEKESIPEGHREGPFIVLKKENGNLISIKGTSVVPSEDNVNMSFYLNNDTYKLNKETYFKLNKLYFIKEYSFINCMDKLLENDKYKLFRQIKLSQKKYYIGENKIMDFNFPIQVGDIIHYYSQNFIVLDTNDKNVICVPVKNHLDYKNNINLDFNNFININFAKAICLQINDNIKYVNTVGNKCIEKILVMSKEYINNYKNTKITQRGTIILKDSKYYYIYGEEGQNWLVFEINKNRVTKFKQLVIGNINYYTKFEESKIAKNDLFTNIYLCIEEEKDKIKNIRKKYKELRKTIEMDGIINYDCFEVGDIIESINYINKRFIIVRTCKKTYECLCIDEIINGIYNPVFIRKTEVKLAKDNSIVGIKWLEEHSEFKLKSISNPRIIDEIFKTQTKFLKDNQCSINVLNNQINNISKDTIVKKDENSDETFKVLEIMGEMLVCQSCNDLGVKHYFNKNSVIVVENKQKRK